MQINPIGAGAAGATPSTPVPKGPAGQSGSVQAGESQGSLTSQTGSASASTSSLSISATQASASQSISALITSFGPYAADQDLMKLLLLLIALEILMGQDKEERQGGGMLMFQAQSTSTYESLEFSYSEAKASYGLSAYNEQSQAVAGTSAGHGPGGAPTGGEPGQNLDLQA